MRSSISDASQVPALLDVHQLSEVLGIPEATLYSWRTHRRGPRGIRVGRHLRYRPEDVQAWIDAQVDGAQHAGGRSGRGL